MNIQGCILKSLKEIGPAFLEDELAYLSSTTKIELPLRDRWAFMLHKSLQREYFVSREWKRTDIAVLDSNKPVALIEIKAMYTFDAALDPENISGFTDAMLRDQDKASALASKDTDIFTVLFATHPNGKYNQELNGIVKYVAGINKAVKRFGTSDNVRKQATAAVNNKLNSRNLILSGSLAAGSAFEQSIDILYWVVKA